MSVVPKGTWESRTVISRGNMQWRSQQGTEGIDCPRTTKMGTRKREKRVKGGREREKEKGEREGEREREKKGKEKGKERKGKEKGKKREKVKGT